MSTVALARSQACDYRLQLLINIFRNGAWNLRGRALAKRDFARTYFPFGKEYHCGN